MRALRRALLQALAACIAALVACAASAQTIVVRDDRGVEHRLPAPPQRIVSLLPSLTETVAALGAAGRLVGVSRYCNWPPQIAQLPRLGGLEDAQIEAIAALKPDLILASAAARSLDRLDALGFTVVRLQSQTHADVRRTLELVARLLGVPDEGRRAWARIENEIARAAARVPPAARGKRVYFEIGGGPYAAGATSFIGETLSRLGLDNVVDPQLGPFPKLNPEYVVRARPDILMGARIEQQALARRPGWGSLAAVREGRLCGFDTAQYEMLIRPGPRLGEAAGLLADCLQRLEPAR